MRDIFDRLSGEMSVKMSDLLLDPVTVDYLDSLTCYTITVSIQHQYTVISHLITHV